MWGSGTLHRNTQVNSWVGGGLGDISCWTFKNSNDYNTTVSIREPSSDFSGVLASVGPYGSLDI